MDSCSPYPDRHWAVFCLSAHRRADTDLYAHTFAFGHIYPYPGSCTDSRSHGRADVHFRNPHSRSYPHACSHRNAGSDTHSHSNSCSCTYSDADPYPRTYSYQHAYSHPNAGSYPDSYPYPCSNTNAK